MGVIAEFKEFVTKGNVFDLAVAFILGVAFNRIVQSLVADIIMPPVSALTGDVRLADRFLVIQGGQYESLEAAQAAGAITLNYGAFVLTVVEFLIVGVVLFLMVRQINRRRIRQQAVVEAEEKDCPFCASPIPVEATRCPECTSTISGS